MTAPGPLAQAGAPPSSAGGGPRDRLPSPRLLFAGPAALTAVPIVPEKLQLVDLVCVAALPFLSRAVVKDRLVRWIAGTLCLWAVGQVVADRVNGLGFTISQPVVAAVATLAVTLVLLDLAAGDPRRMRFLVAGVTLGLVVNLLLGARGHPVGDPASWKYGYNVPVSIFLLAVTDLWWRRGRRLPSFLALAAVCALGLVTDQRSLAAFALLTGLLMAPRPPRSGTTRMPALVAGVGVLLLLLVGLFIQTASSGLLGQRSAVQLRQFGTDPVAILVNVRPEAFQEAFVFAQRPWTGWGSQPRMDGATYAASQQFLVDLGVRQEDIANVLAGSDVPGVAEHSTIMDTLTRAGMWAVPFWILALTLALGAGAAALRSRSSPLVVLWTASMIWDFFFSPITGLLHVSLAAYLALAVTTVRTSGAEG